MVEINEIYNGLFDSTTYILNGGRLEWIGNSWTQSWRDVETKVDIRRILQFDSLSPNILWIGCIYGVFQDWKSAVVIETRESEEEYS